MSYKKLPSAVFSLTYPLKALCVAVFPHNDFYKTIHLRNRPVPCISLAWFPGPLNYGRPLNAASSGKRSPLQNLLYLRTICHWDSMVVWWYSYLRLWNISMQKRRQSVASLLHERSANRHFRIYNVKNRIVKQFYTFISRC